jgi:hypothetical protein
MVARRSLQVVLAVGCVFAVVLGVGVGSAGAFEAHGFEGGFGETGVFGAVFPEGRPGAVAVDPVTGSLYVGDAFYHTEVQKFNLNHEPEAFGGIGANILGNKLGGFGISFWQLAVSPTNEDLYVASDTPVKAYEPDGEPADFSEGPGAGTNELPGSEVCGVAVDASGDIYVSEYSIGVSVFASSGKPLTKFAASDVCHIAVDSKGVVYVSSLPVAQKNASGPVEKFIASGPPPVSASTSYQAGGIIDPNGSFALAVDQSTNHLYVDEGSQVAEYDSTGARIGSFGATGPGALPAPDAFGTGIAVDDVSGKVYVGQGDFEGQIDLFGPAILLPDVTTGPASEIQPKGTATLNGTVNPDGVQVTECFFEYGTSTSYGQRAECEPEAVGSGTSEVAVSAKLKELESGATYHFRLAASNKTALNDNPVHDGGDEVFVTPPRPSIDGASATNVARTSADLNVQINPGGSEVTYHFEYGTSPYKAGEGEHVHGSSVGGGVIPAGTSDVAIAPVQVTELLENETYYWRVVATNAAGTTLGADHTFVYDTSGEGLPDHRAYEMVTPPQKNGSLIGDVFIGLQPSISEDGSRVMATSIQCFGSEVESCTGARAFEGEPFLFSRTSSGWVTKALAPPGSFEGNTAWADSAEAGDALFSAPTPPMLEDDFYVRGADGSFLDIGPGTPPAGGAVFPPWDGTGVVATSDFSRVIYQEAASLWFGEDGHPTPLEYSGTGNTAPVPVGVSGGPGSTDLISACGTNTGVGGNTTPGEVSADGETVYFTAESCGAGTGANAKTPVPVNEVFARIGEARTVAISEPAAFSAAAPYPGCEAEPCVKDVNERANWGGASFAGASEDGSKAFFTSAQKLTDSASAGSSNLYEYDFDSSAAEGDLVDVSAGDTSGHGPRVLGVMAVSSDGSHVYFVAQGVLTTAANGLGESAREGANNVYVFERDAAYPRGRIAFVTQLPKTESEQWTRNDNGTYANVTPDGRFLVFESHGSELTPDETRTDGATQVFRYDAQTGELVRVSIGQRGFNDNGNAGVGNAEIVPEIKGGFQAGPARRDPTMSHDGSFVFFVSPIGLTPHALNDVQISPGNYAENVYEWHEGQVYLISDGRDTATFGGETSAVILWGSDATGANVFFSTVDQLVPQDTDTQEDFYDARICEPERGNPCITQPPPPLPPCLGEACHGTPAAQLGAPSAGTVTFNGQGDLSEPASRTVAVKRGKTRVARCAKGRRRVRGRCVKVKVRGGKARKSRSHRGGK